MAVVRKAVLHVSGSLLRKAWYSKDLESCIVVRPAGRERDSVGYVVNQAKFDGPADMVFDAKPRKADVKKGVLAQSEGHVGGLPGFDGSVLVYLAVDEAHLLVQPHAGDAFIRFADFKKLIADAKVSVRRIDPRIEVNC